MHHSPARPWKTLTDDTRCPCLSGNTYGTCCGPLHRGEPAPTATRLMRSRYTGFVVGDAAYLLATWYATTRPAEVDLDPAIRWFGLEIVRATGGGPFDSRGTVEFVARYRLDSQVSEQREDSRFVRESGHWFYIDAV